MRIKSPRDFWAGLMFIGFGLFACIWAVTNYQMGSAVRMGPAYFPAVLGGLLALLGLIVLIESLAITGPPVAKINLRPLRDVDRPEDLARLRSLRFPSVLPRCAPR